ncbi:MAG: hypothetical protein IT376_16645 [Polyangiaceae bacterium]|nr:hypothetical protein [Polyangiaceae bacterium]
MALEPQEPQNELRDAGSRSHVRGGRLVLDEPTDLPEGAVVEFVPVEEVETDDDERERFDAALELSTSQARAGQLVDADEVIRELMARERSWSSLWERSSGSTRWTRGGVVTVQKRPGS